MEMEGPTVTLSDEAGRSLTCYIELSVEVAGEEYALLHPVDYPVDIFAWIEDENTEDEDETLVAVEEPELDEIFSTAEAVLAEQNLKLKRTALSLTVEGDLPEVDEDEILILETENGAGAPAETDEYQLLTGFFHEEKEYAIYTPIDPLLFVARMKDDNQPELLSPEEFQKIQPILEDQLFDDLG